MSDNNNRLSGVISDEAFEAISKKLKQFDIKGGLDTKRSAAILKELTPIIIADLDGADGQFDGKFDVQKLRERLKRFPDLKGTKDYDMLFVRLATDVAEVMTSNAHTTNQQLQDAMNKRTEHNVEVLNADHNDKLTKEELSVMPRLKAKTIQR